MILVVVFSNYIFKSTFILDITLESSGYTHTYSFSVKEKEFKAKKEIKKTDHFFLVLV